jgi:hypothetical protein
MNSINFYTIYIQLEYFMYFSSEKLCFLSYTLEKSDFLCNFVKKIYDKN